MAHESANLRISLPEQTETPLQTQILLGQLAILRMLEMKRTNLNRHSERTESALAWRA